MRSDRYDYGTDPSARLPRHPARLSRDRRVKLAFASRAVGELLLAEPQRLGKIESTHGFLDPVAKALRDLGREHRPGTRTDELLECAPLRVGQLHPRMVGIATDMVATPDDILRALADPERLAIAGGAS